MTFTSSHRGGAGPPQTLGRLPQLAFPLEAAQLILGVTAR